MQYISTRNKNCRFSAAEAIFRGIADDGGLFVPEYIPQVSDEEVKNLSSMTYIERAKYILSLYLTDFSAEQIESCVNNAYGSGFDDNIPAPVSKQYGKISFLELWHGETCAFKDMALQLLPELMRVSAKKVSADKTVLILVATSGDTGKAALEGFKDVDGVKIQVFYPVDGVSNMQKRQMSVQEGENVSVVAIKGNFDNAQAGVKRLFADRDFNKKLFESGYVLSSANSINWGRLLPQIIYYFSAYCDMVNSGTISFGEKINVTVPTGNFGNILAAYYSEKMGLPINKLICASNKNNVLTEFINTGRYNKNREFYATHSPSMDILISSNVERLLFMLHSGDDKKVSELMESLNKSGEYSLGEEELSTLNSFFSCGYCDDEETEKTIRAEFREYGYLIDTHTAVALNVAKSYIERENDTRAMLVVSTASPYKFANHVLKAIWGESVPSDDFEITSKLSEVSGTKIPQPIVELVNKKIRFTDVYESSDMQRAVEDFLEIAE